MSILLTINLLVVVILFKELKLTTFDSMLAATMGFAPTILNYIIITLVSLTTSKF